MPAPPPCVPFVEYVLVALEHPPDMYVSKLAACCTTLFLTRTEPELLRTLCLKWAIRFREDKQGILTRIRDRTRGGRNTEVYLHHSTDSIVDILQNPKLSDPETCVEHFFRLMETLVVDYFSWNWHRTEDVIRINRECEAYVRQKLIPLCASANVIEDAEDVATLQPYKSDPRSPGWPILPPRGLSNSDLCSEASINDGINDNHPPKVITFVTVSSLFQCIHRATSGLVLIFHANYTSKSRRVLKIFKSILKEDLLEHGENVCVVHGVAEPELTDMFNIMWFPTIVYIPPIEVGDVCPHIEALGGNMQGASPRLLDIHTSGSSSVRNYNGSRDDVSDQHTSRGDVVSLNAEMLDSEKWDGTASVAKHAPQNYEEELSRLVSRGTYRVYPSDGDLSSASLVAWVNSKGETPPVRGGDDGTGSCLNILRKGKGFLKQIERTTTVELLRKLQNSVETTEGAPHCDEAPLFVFLGGGMAAGKSTAVAALSRSPWWEKHRASCVTVNADCFKESAPPGFVKLEEVHEYSTRMAEKLIVTSVNMGQNIVFDSTMMWAPFIRQLISMLRNAHNTLYEQGVGYKDGGTVEEYFRPVGPRPTPLQKPYQIRLLAITVEPDIAVRRGILRNFSTGQSAPIQTQLRSFRLFAENFNEYVSLVDTVTLYNNNVFAYLGKGELPPVIAEKTDDQLEIRDTGAFALFLRQQHLNENASNAEELYSAVRAG
ncbi:hypothetical protein TRVL_01599 [Trypanosoma vivax]|nr:hypothetical protein TRVL_01599 [Trypanosoma vivax]